MATPDKFPKTMTIPFILKFISRGIINSGREFLTGISIFQHAHIAESNLS